MTAREYYNLVQEALPIIEDYGYYLRLDRQLRREAPNFDHPRLYAALKTLFGESTTAYDEYKCSFGYQFLLHLTRKGKVSEYAFNFTDIKGGIHFMFRKILTTPEEIERYKDKNVLRKPFEDDFAKAEMAYFMTWFTFYLVGFMHSFEEYYNEEFIRTQDYCFMIYGYKNGGFFLEQYEDRSEFYIAKRRLLESEDIPFNRTKANL